MKTLAELMGEMPQTGSVVWLGVRPERRAPMTKITRVESKAGLGLTGDRYASAGGRRQVTLIQTEHLEAVSSIMGKSVLPADVRRNIAVRGINLLALKGQQFQIGAALFAYTGLCHPCSRMETILGAGGYNAMRGHGGITAQVVSGGVIAIDDEVRLHESV